MDLVTLDGDRGSTLAQAQSHRADMRDPAALETALSRVLVFHRRFDQPVTFRFVPL
jgi:hypothetical protein